ncbi:MAG: hypothetical protein B0W54_04655 [Cellvibrio sp. 79]|nr:MAG: hypothetical protein B0W54_04655 [Cellvibrio sp. 79]
MKKNESQIILELDSFGSVNEDNLRDFEDLITDAYENKGDKIIKSLLFSLSDQCEFDEVMFRVVHTLESFPLDKYLQELGDNITALFHKSPRWISILHTRIMNSPKIYETYLSEYSSLDISARNTLSNLLELISKKEKFYDRCIYGIEYIKKMEI